MKKDICGVFIEDSGQVQESGLACQDQKPRKKRAASRDVDAAKPELETRSSEFAVHGQKTSGAGRARRAPQIREEGWELNEAEERMGQGLSGKQGVA